MADDLVAQILHLAAFSDGDQGGNLAGVLLADEMPPEADMLAAAAAVGYSETAFLAPITPEVGHWRVRYFSPQMEVPFCGHATIALTAALAEKTGQSDFTLALNHATVTTKAVREGDKISASLISPPTSSTPIAAEVVDDFCALFGWTAAQLDNRLPPVFMSAGARHMLLPLTSRTDLAEMAYDFEAGLQLMTAHDLVTIMAVWQEAPDLFHVRNAFAVGGVVEDPATGAAAAAFAAYLQECRKEARPALTLVQGEDMGMRSVIHTRAGPHLGDGVEVTGQVRHLS